MNMILSVIVFVGLVSFGEAEQLKESTQTIDHPNKNEYSSVLVGSDKHKYGYELKENRHFHHTTTEEDGVRLGCYGYVLQGKKYSTQYVADVKGYRPVFTHDAITVYPKSGGERKASFVGGFKEDQQRSENIRYFFPDGCKGSDVTVAPVVLPMPPNVRIFTNSNEPVNPPISKVPTFTGNTKTPKIPFEFVQPPFGPVESQLVNLIPGVTPSPASPRPPVTPSTAPVTPAKPPVTPTKAPVTPAKPPVTPTKAPVTPSKAPVTPAKAPVTNASVIPTKAPTPPSKIPVDQTKSPVTPSKTSVTAATPPKVTAGGNSPTANTVRPTSAPLLTKIPAPPASYSETPTKTSPTVNPLARNNLIPPKEDKSTDTCSKSCCDDESIAKLILPIPMKGQAKSSDSCEKFAKLVIPIEGLSVENLKSLASGSDSAALIKKILQSLS